ncbi:MAG: hypothetical protein ACRCZ2_09350 [Fusobacteriaceae bacterium]
MIKEEALIKIRELEKELGLISEINTLKILLPYIQKNDVRNECLKLLQRLEKYSSNKKVISSLKVGLNNYNLKSKEKNINMSSNSGYGYTSLETGNKVDQNYTMYQSSKSHGYAAEKMNNLHDNLNGKNAKIVGDDNAKNGADRLVDGVEIQTKFCATGRRCITECLDKNGQFKYIDSNGNPMKIEVPKDKYDEAVKVMEEKIRNGKVPEIRDPREASTIVKKSPFTYEQAKNVAKFGTIESVTYDAVEGIKTAGVAMGISAALSFAHSIWNGESVDVALKNSCRVGIQVGGVSWVSSIATKQLARTSFQSTIRVGTDALAKQIGPKVAATIVNASRSMTGGAAIYGGAAMKSFSKMLSGNVVTGAVVTVVMSSADVYRMFQGKASGKQVAKTITKSAAGVAGGTGGMLAGAGAGAAIGSIVPVIGTTIGGFVGGFFGAFSGGAAAQKVTEVIMDDWLEIKDDIDEMMDIFNEEFSILAFDFLLSAKEVEKIIEKIKNMDIPEEMRNMYQSSDRKGYARKLIFPLIGNTIKNRKKIYLPKESQILNSLESILV